MTRFYSETLSSDGMLGSGEREEDESRMRAGYYVEWERLWCWGADNTRNGNSLIEASGRKRQTGGEQGEHQTPTEQPGHV